MSDSSKRINYGPAVILGLAMALGPLTALSLGSRYAGEETWARANAGLENYEPSSPLDAYGPSGATAATPTYAQDKSVLDVVASSGVLQSFDEAIRGAGLEHRLEGAGAYTVFVPSDEAFSRMSEAERNAILGDREAMSDFLDSHVVPGRLTATDLMSMREATTLGGDSIDVGPSARYNGHIGVGGAKVAKTNLFAANGIVHIVDHAVQ